MGLILNAVLGGGIAGFLCGSLGTLTSKLNLNTICFTVAHAALLGATLGLCFGFNPHVSSLIVSLIVALLLAYFSDKLSAHLDLLAMLTFSVCNALALMLIYFYPSPTLSSVQAGIVLWGSVLALTPRLTLFLLAVLIFYALVMLVFWSRLESLLFDRRIAMAEGLNVKFYDALILCIAALTISSTLLIVGGFLVFTLVYVPALAISRMIYSMRLRLIAGGIIGFASTQLGLLLSFSFDIPVGCSIVFSAVIIAFLIYFYQYLAERRRISFLRRYDG